MSWPVWMVILTVLEKDNAIQFAMHTSHGQEGKSLKRPWNIQSPIFAHYILTCRTLKGA